MVGPTSSQCFNLVTADLNFDINTFVFFVQILIPFELYMY